MSDALEALTQAHDLIMHNTVTEVMPDGEPDWPEWACEAMAKIKRASAALEQGEAKPVAWMMCWRGNHFTASREEAEQWMSEDMDEDVPVIPLYTAPPSTADMIAPKGHEPTKDGEPVPLMVHCSHCGSYEPVGQSQIDSLASTAEAKVRIKTLENFASAMRLERAKGPTISVTAYALAIAASKAEAEAKRIREEGK